MRTPTRAAIVVAIVEALAVDRRLATIYRQLAGTVTIPRSRDPAIARRAGAVDVWTPAEMSTVSPVTAGRRWEASERVLESGGFESRQRVVVAEPVVEASEAGARTLGVVYWQAVDRFTRGGVRASWTGAGGKLKLLGGATLLTFGPPELSFDGELVSCRHAIRGGLLALRAGGSVTLAQRPENDQHELSVTVEEYLPRLAARVGAPFWTGMLYAKGQSPLHAAVSRRYFELLQRSRGA